MFSKKPKVQVETFSGKALRPNQYIKKRITTEDLGHILVQFENGARGMVSVSEVAAGRKNHIVFEVYGTKKALWWDHERPNELMIGNRNKPNGFVLKDGMLMDESIRDYAHYPAGHNEGYPTCVKNFCRNVYRHIRNRRRKVDFATFEDGHIANAIVDAVLLSSEKERWVAVKE